MRSRKSRSKNLEISGRARRTDQLRAPNQLAKRGRKPKRAEHGGSDRPIVVQVGQDSVRRSQVRITEPKAEDVVSRGAPLTCISARETPLVSAMRRAQIQGAKELWALERATLTELDDLGEVGLELIDIGVDRTLPAGRAHSGFVQKGSRRTQPHPRALEIGWKLFEEGGIELLELASDVVSDVLGKPAAEELSECWYEVRPRGPESTAEAVT